MARSVAGVEYSSDGRFIAFAVGRSIKVFDAGTAQSLWSQDTGWRLWLMGLSTDGKKIITAGLDSEGIGNPAPYVFATQTGEIVCRLGSGSECPNLDAIKLPKAGTSLGLANTTCCFGTQEPEKS